MKNVFDCGFFELKTANFIQVIFSDILLFFVIVENSHLNIVWTDRPNVKILNVAELVHEYGRFANFYFAVFIWWINHFSSALYNWFVFGENVVPFRPVLSQIPWVWTLGFLFCYNFPWYHVIVDDFTFQFKLFDCIKGEIVWIVNLFVLMRRSCNHDTEIFWVKNFLKLIVSDLGFVFGLYADVLFCDNVLWNLKRKEDFLDENWGFLSACLIISDKIFKETDGFLLYNVESFFLNGNSLVRVIKYLKRSR